MKNKIFNNKEVKKEDAVVVVRAYKYGKLI